MNSKKAPKQLNSPFVAKAMKFSSKAVVWVYRRTGGRIGGNWRVGAAFKKPVPTLLLEHRGRKSGKQFVSPLVYMTGGDDVIIVASMGGRAENPQWYHNLVATPGACIEIGPERRPVRAVLAAQRTGRGYGRSWSRRTPTSIPTRVGPPGRSRCSSCSPVKGAAG